MSEVTKLRSQWIGLIDYSTMLKKQLTASERVRKSHEEAIVYGLEHKSVITLGVRGEKSEDLLISDKDLQDRGFELLLVKRGGQATLHNPGQLVIYPIIPLRKWRLGVKEYVSLLQNATVNYLEARGVLAWVAKDEPGVYTEKGKIGYFGLQVSNGVALHGLSINITNSLSDFAFISSCGKPSDSFDALSFYHDDLSLESEFFVWLNEFEKLF